MRVQPERKRVVVIGAGLGGLAIALRLAGEGRKVTVCERAEQPGGKMGRMEIDGFRFDTGPSLITMPRVFHALFEAVGERMEDHLALIPVRPAAEYVFDDGTRFTHTTSLPDWLATVRRLEGGDASGFLRFMHLGARLLALSEATFFQQAPGERPDPAALGALVRSLPVPGPWTSYDRVVRRYFRSDALRRMFQRYTTYIGSSPYKTPGLLAVIPALEYLEGAWHIEGGLYRLVEVLGSLLHDRGGRVLLRTAVERIETEDGEVTGVRTAGGEFLPADTVIMNGDVDRLSSLLGREGPTRPERCHSTSGLVFFHALGHHHPEAPHHRVLFSADYREEFADLFARRRFPSDPTVYLNMPSRSDPSMTPGYGEVLFIMANAPANEGDAWDEAMIDEARQRVNRRLERAGLRALLEDSVASGVFTPRMLADRLDMPGGAIYGATSHGPRQAFLRPPNRVRGVRGLYCVGGSTHPGGGTPTVLLSARIVHNQVRDDEQRYK